MRKVLFLDTTLRDGEQTPGVHMSRADKCETAKRLADLGVDVIEAGFPASSDGDFKAVSEIAAEVKGPVIAALCRAERADIDTAFKALAAAERKRIHIFIATSDIHIEHKLKSTREAVLATARDAVAYAKTLCGDIQFSPEDAGRTDLEYLCSVLTAVIDAGATTVNIPDTVGYLTPPEMHGLISKIREKVPNISNAVISVHCHDDLGNATANSLAAIEAGASQIECTVNGIGERAGNAPLEEIVMNLSTRTDRYGVSYNIDTKKLTRTSRYISSVTALPLPPNKAIVGANAFAHEAGIHQHGVLCDARTYEVMTPESVGLTRKNLVLGKLSGHHAFADRLHELGYNLDGEGITECFSRFKSLADKKQVDDSDISAIVNEYLDSKAGKYSLVSFQIQSGSSSRAMAMVCLAVGDTSVTDAAVGDGPVDAAFNAVSRLAGADSVKLEEYSIKAVTEGTDALGEARVKVRIDGTYYSGTGLSTDIIESSIRAYINALNKWCL